MYQPAINVERSHPNILPTDVRPEERPHGLTSDLKVPYWTFERGNRPRPLRTPWTMAMPNGHPVSHTSNDVAFKTARRYFTTRRNGLDGSEPLSLSTCDTQKLIVLLCLKYVRSEGYESLSAFPKRRADDLIHAAARNFKSTIPGPLVSDILRQNFNVLRNLHLYYMPRAGGRLLNDGLAFDPFTSEEDMYMLAQRLGREKGQTPDAPAEVVFNYLNAAIEYVAIYADDIISLREASEREARAIAEDGTLEKEHHRALVVETLLSLRDEEVAWRPANLSALRVAVSERTGINNDVLHSLRYTRIFRNALKFYAADDANATKLGLDLMATAAKTKLTGDRNREIAKRIGLPFTGTSGRVSPWPITVFGYSPWTERSLYRVVVDLWTSCWVILASFMADRASETLALTTDCLVRGLDGYYLDTPNFKTHGTDAGAILRQPCPTIVAMAVEVLIRLGAAAREKAGSTQLFFTGDSETEWVVAEHTLRNRIIKFGASVRASRYDLGRKVWRLAPHQLRRFFVTAWINYNEYGTRFPSLMKFLDQESLSVVVRYGTRPRQGESLTRQRRAHADRLTAAMAFEGVDAVGPAAAELYELFNQMRIRVIPKDREAEWLAARNEREDVQVDPMPWGYCIWSKNSGAFARCIAKSKRKMGLARPEHRKSECICGDGCRNFFTTDAFAPFWEGSYARHERISQNPAAPSRMIAAARRGVATAKKYRGS